MWRDMIRLTIYEDLYERAEGNEAAVRELQQCADLAADGLLGYWRLFGVLEGSALDCREEEAHARTCTERYTNINFSKVALRRYARLASLALIEQWNIDPSFEDLVRGAIESELPGGKWPALDAAGGDSALGEVGAGAVR
jgi:hypothetical protein